MFVHIIVCLGLSVSVSTQGYISPFYLSRSDEDFFYDGTSSASVMWGKKFYPGPEVIKPFFMLILVEHEF